MLEMDFLSTITAIICTVCTILVIKFLIQNHKYMNVLKDMPGPKIWPVLGTVQNVGAPPESLIRLSVDMHKQYGSLFLIVTPFIRVVIVSDADYFEKVLSSTEEITKSIGYKFLHPWLGTGLLTATGEKWQLHRKMFTPTFHFKILETFVDIFEEKSQILVNRLKTVTPGTHFDMYPYITRCTLDIICETAMGINMDMQIEQHMGSDQTNYISAIHVVSETTTSRLFRPWLFPDWMFKLSSLGKSYFKALTSLHAFTQKVVAEKSAVWRKNNTNKEESSKGEDNLGIKKKQAFLDLLLEASEGNRLTEAELRQEVDTFMFEGHDTTTSAISWCLMLLGNHPEIQDKVVEELQSIFKGQNRKITMNDLKEMKYLEMVIKEALRLYPSVPFIGRKLVNDMRLDKYLIPAGTEIRLGIYNVHRSPKHYSNPTSFNPDNFLPELVKNRHPYAFVPFSAGPRNCIGQKFAIFEEKTVLASILLNFQVESIEKMEDVLPLPELILRPKSGLQVKLHPRSEKVALK